MFHFFTITTYCNFLLEFSFLNVFLLCIEGFFYLYNILFLDFATTFILLGCFVFCRVGHCHTQIAHREVLNSFLSYSFCFLIYYFLFISLYHSNPSALISWIIISIYKFTIWNYSITLFLIPVSTPRKYFWKSDIKWSFD